LNVASLGFLIDVSQKTDRKAINNLGVLAYYLKGAEE
jgi:diacylglycerol kinase family enzyme